LLQLESLWAFHVDGKLESLEMVIWKLLWLCKFCLVVFGTRWERESKRIMTPEPKLSCAAHSTRI
jgi:hypothetical protein